LQLVVAAACDGGGAFRVAANACQHHTQVPLDVTSITADYRTICHGYMFIAVSKHLLYLLLQA
jgi:hypothetical protein